ncbi:hypothetical protein [Anabaenopsis elenkinii]
MANKRQGEFAILVSDRFQFQGLGTELQFNIFLGRLVLRQEN